MEQYEIEEYIKTHERFINKVIGNCNVKLTLQEREDIAQELRITMYRCLLKYDPRRNISLDGFVTHFMKKRLGNYVRDNFKGRNLVYYNSISLSDPINSDIESPNLGETLHDSRDVTEKLVDARVITDNLIALLDEETASIVRLWSEGHSLRYLANEQGIAVSTIYNKLQSAFAYMREVAEEGE